jgi:hypothetical protein
MLVLVIEWVVTKVTRIGSSETFDILELFAFDFANLLLHATFCYLGPWLD